MKEMTIENTKPTDLEFIYGMFDAAIAYQKKNHFPVWPDYDKNTLINDVKEQRQFKILIEGELACIFSICYSDKVVWREKDDHNAIYLHRIVVNQDCKGRRLFGLVLDWVIKKATELDLVAIRMDTWADNPSIISYYQGFGFKIVDFYTTPDTEELPIQQRNNEIVLLEYRNTN